jgi:hypothetical protein
VAASSDVVIEDGSLRLSAVRGSVRGTRLASFDPPRAGGTGFRLAGDLTGEARNPDRTLGCGSAQVRGWRLREGRGAVRGSRWRVCGKGSDIERGAAVSVERGHAIIANLGSVSNSVGQRGGMRASILTEVFFGLFEHNRTPRHADQGIGGLKILHRHVGEIVGWVLTAFDNFILSRSPWNRFPD